MKEISEAINKVMSEVNWVAKSMTVWTWNSSYKWVSDKDVREKIRESMITNWLSILPIWVKSKIQIDRWEETNDYWTKSKQSVFTEVETKYLLLHTSWQSIELAWYGQWVDTQDKWAWKSTTYALKNTLLNMFLIPTWVDTDNTHSDDYDVPPKTTESDLSRIADKNIENLKQLITTWKSFTMADIRKKYKVSKVNAEKLIAIWITK